MGVPETPKTPKTFQQTQDELFSKLEALAVAKSKSIAMTNSPKSPPRRRINSAQFKTPSVAEMEELAKIVVANASPPKTQNKLRKR
ncbi:hypothetical protein EDD11_007770 [Mortierella claussenii]|nr:hypothetical protein EDD11_007770 [Mortierella claussenii]